MNSVRRLFLILYSVVLVAACGGLIALAWNDSKQLDIDVADFNLVAFVNGTDEAKIGFTVILGLVIAVGLLSLWLALKPDSSVSKGTLRLKQADGGVVEVSAVQLETLLREEIEALPEVRQAIPKVRVGEKGSIESDITVVIEPSANIAHLTNLVAQTTANVLTEQVGVTSVKRPAIRVTYDEINARTQRVERAKPQRETPAREPEPVPTQAEIKAYPPPPTRSLDDPEPVVSGESERAVKTESEHRDRPADD